MVFLRNCAIKSESQVRVFIVANLNKTGRGQELSSRSVQRGYFLQLLAESFDAPFSPDSMFLLGLFSMLDAILDQPMPKIIEDLPLENEMASTLCGEKTRAKPWLHLVQYQEKAEWIKLKGIINELGLMPELTAASYVKALAWAGELKEKTT
jgi:EAL and modified HD-GYP domain-containing signal transduction protein